eukprot:4353889-Pyramimonas_sp.AAC.1
MRMRRRRTTANPRPITDVGINPPSKLSLHRPLEGFSSTGGSAPLGDNRLKTLKRAKTPLSGLPRHESP